jgi:hypothetical protein
MYTKDNLQKYFDIAVSGVLKQGNPSISNSGNCKYRGMNNDRCAIGWLIPDDMYNPKMEGFSINNLCDKYSFPDYIINNLTFFDRLQTCHDFNSEKVNNAEFIDAFKNDVKKLALKYNLSTEVLDNHNQK